MTVTRAGQPVPIAHGSLKSQLPKDTPVATVTATDSCTTVMQVTHVGTQVQVTSKRWPERCQRCTAGETASGAGARSQELPQLCLLLGSPPASGHAVCWHQRPTFGHGHITRHSAHASQQAGQLKSPEICAGGTNRGPPALALPSGGRQQASSHVLRIFFFSFWC